MFLGAGVWHSTAVVVVFAFVLVLHFLILYIIVCSDLYVFGRTLFLYLGIWTWILLKVVSFWSSLCNKGNTFPHNDFCILKRSSLEHIKVFCWKYYIDAT